jgi:DNA repair protein RadC
MSVNSNSLPSASGEHSSLCIRDEGGAWRPATGEEIITAARAALARRVRKGTALSSPSDVRDYLKVKLSALDHEVFCALFLDTRHRLIEYRELFRGTIDGATVYPREVVKEALNRNAAAVIFAHNHPSGVAEPSEADRSITMKLSKALALVEVRVLDHVVVAGDASVSFAARGLL